MTTSTAIDPTTAPRPTSPAPSDPDGRVTLRRVISAELIKLRTLRSTVAAALIAAVSIMAAGVFAAIGIIVAKPHDGGAGTAAAADPAGKDRHRRSGNVPLPWSSI